MERDSNELLSIVSEKVNAKKLTTGSLISSFSSFSALMAR